MFSPVSAPMIIITNSPWEWLKAVQHSPPWWESQVTYWTQSSYFDWGGPAHLIVAPAFCPPGDDEPGQWPDLSSVSPGQPRDLQPVEAEGVMWAGHHRDVELQIRMEVSGSQSPAVRQTRAQWGEWRVSSGTLSGLPVNVGWFIALIRCN